MDLNDNLKDAANRYDVVVIGAGAAGMMAAGRSAERGRRTLLLEKNRKPGVKILISGGTRCNLTHDCDERGIMAAFGSSGPFLNSALAAFGVESLLRFFCERGLATYIEPGTGKHFPITDRAVDVVRVLQEYVQETGVFTSYGEPVVNIMQSDAGFHVATSLRTIEAQKVILAVGGASYAKCGTTGDGYAWAVALGHSVRPPRPALTPLTSDEPWVTSLAGVTLDALVRVVDPVAAKAPLSAKSRRLGMGPGVLMERRGALLFTHFGLSGPAAMDVSRAVSGRNPRDLELRIDFLPDVPEHQLEQQLRNASQLHGKRQLNSCLPETLQKRLVAALLAQAGLSGETKMAELSRQGIMETVQAVKNARIQVSGTQGFSKAEVTAGGVALGEVDSRSMESKRTPGLFFAGEILDFDGLIGGYNFQAAFATGYLAGSSV